MVIIHPFSSWPSMSLPPLANIQNKANKAVTRSHDCTDAGGTRPGRAEIRGNGCFEEESAPSCGGDGPCLRLWEPLYGLSGSLYYHIRTHDPRFYSPLTRDLFTVCTDGKARCWDITSGGLLQVQPQPQPSLSLSNPNPNRHCHCLTPTPTSPLLLLLTK